MKQRYIAILIMVGLILTALLSSCNAMNEPDVSKSISTEVGNTVLSQDDNSEAIKDMGKATDDNMNKKYKLSVDNFKFARDYKSATGYVVKNEISNLGYEKLSASTERTLQKASSEARRVVYTTTNSDAITRCYTDIYQDKVNPKYNYFFDNLTGEYKGFMRIDPFDIGENHIIKTDEDFKDKAIEKLKELGFYNNYEMVYEAFTPFAEPKGMVLSEKFIPSNHPESEIAIYYCNYAKVINGITTAEGVSCYVFADGLVTYVAYNTNMFESISVPDIDLNEVMLLATDKATDMLDSIPDTYELKSVELKNYRYSVNKLGQLELHFSFAYRAQPKEESIDGIYCVTLYDGCDMAIVFD